MSEPQAQARHALHWLPNALTVSRILLIPVLVWAILNGFNSLKLNMTYDIKWVILLATFIFAYCMISDFFDGYFARKWQITSHFGRMLDPIADKLLVASSLFSICIVMNGSYFIVIPSMIIIGRDIFVSGIREHAANSNIVLSPTKLAKWKTTFEMIAILLFLCAFIFTSPIDYGEYNRLSHPPAPEPNEILGLGFLGTLWLAATLSAYTGFHYFRSAMRKT